MVSKNPYLLKNCLDRYKTQEMSDKSVDAKICPTIEFVHDWFVNNIKDAKKYKQKITACSMACNKMIGLVLARR